MGVLKMNSTNKMLFLALFCLLAISTVQSADMTIKCYTGIVVLSDGNKEKVLQEETCESGVTQCLKIKTEGDAYMYGCSETEVQTEECVKERGCICTGNLCNSASDQGI